jgi:hypothetical protein
MINAKMRNETGSSHHLLSQYLYPLPKVTEIYSSNLKGKAKNSEEKMIQFCHKGSGIGMV